MEETAYEWESIKGMTDTMLIEKEIMRIENERRRLLKRLDYLNIIVYLINNNKMKTNQESKQI
jgi:hypothetical protein